MIRADHLSMIFVLFFAVTISWLQVTSGDLKNETVLVPVLDDKSGIEMYVIRHELPRAGSCGNVCNTFVLNKSLGFSSGYVQASIMGQSKR